MKIRISDDSIRLRLDRTEVDRIGAMDSVVCYTHFNSGAVFQYSLTPVGNLDEPSAEFDQNGISVIVPSSMSGRWAAEETEVSITGTQTLPGASQNRLLSILIEKDFECLEPRIGEDQSNRFVNPKAVG